MSTIMKNNITKPLVALIMGSKNDWETMQFCEEILVSLKIPYITKVISAHRTPERMTDFSKSADEEGLQVIIAGAGELLIYLAWLLHILIFQ